MNAQNAILKQDSQETQLNMLLAMRQVYAKNLDVVAFDPMLKKIDGDDGQVTDADMQSLGVVIAETYASVPAGKGQKAVPCFLRITDNVLEKFDLPLFPKSQFILELVPSENASRHATKFKEFFDAGYRIAITVNTNDVSVIAPYLDFLHILKIDFSEMQPQQAADLIAAGKAQGVELHATNLKSNQDFLTCINLGFNSFSGDVLGQPLQNANKKLGNNKVVLFQLMAELQKEDTSIAEIERIVLQDPNLTFKILKIVNSAALGLSREVNSVSHAIGILGMDQIRRWVSVFLLESDGDKPQEIMRTSLVRARMCELIAELNSEPLPMSFFMVGLLSRLDLITDIAMSEIVEQIPLSRDIKAALVEREGALGKTLKEVEAYESGDFEALEGLLDLRYYEICYRHSNAWANRIQGAMAS